jgi:uncharacterized protein YyaL (SSP411 family)
MLINYIRESYRELTGQLTPEQAVVTLRSSKPAANADSYKKAEMQARRHRRQRRLDRAVFTGTNGWSVRTW